MGIDYYRFSLADDSCQNRLKPLIQQQALAFQSVWGWSADSRDAGVEYALMESIHKESYLTASDALRTLIEFPAWDEAVDNPADIPTLEASWRVYPITNNPVFPPLLRLEAHRTLLPEDLPTQLEKWKTWATDVANGGHSAYVRELHLHATTDFLRYHWSLLRGHATESLKKTNNWTKKPTLQAVRDRILPLAEPEVYNVPIVAGASNGKTETAKYDSVFDSVKQLLDLTREWNRNVKGNWKIPNYTNNYWLSLDDFVENATSETMRDFFQWLDECVERKFGVYLDY